MKPLLEPYGIIGPTYSCGNICLSKDGYLFSPVGHRIMKFCLNNNCNRILPWETANPITHLAVSRNIIIAVDLTGQAILGDYNRGIILTKIHFKKGIDFLKFSHDGCRLAVAVRGKITLWKVELKNFHHLSLLSSFSLHKDKVNYLEWSHDDKFLISCSDDMTAKIINPDEKQTTILRGGHKHSILSAHFFYFELTQYVVTIGRDGLLLVWENFLTDPQIIAQHRLDLNSNLKEGKGLVPEDYRPWISVTAWNFNCSLLAVGFVNGNVAIYKLELLDLNRLYSFSPSFQTISTISFFGDLIAFGSKECGLIALWDWKSEIYIFKQVCKKQLISCQSFAPFSSNTLATGDTEGNIKIWDIDKCLSLHTFTERHSKQVLCVQFGSKSNRVLISIGLDGKIFAFDCVRLKCFRKIDTQLTLAPLLAIHPSGDILVVVDSLSLNLVIIDLQIGKIIENLSGHTSQISSIGFDSIGRILWSSSWDGSLRIWNFLDPSSKVKVLKHKTEITHACIRPDGREIAAATIEGNISFWSLVDHDESDPTEGKLLRVIETRSDLSPTVRKGSSLVGVEGMISSISFSLDGAILYAVGAFPFIALYDSEFRIFLKRINLTSKKPNQQDHFGLNFGISCEAQTISVLTSSSIYIFKSQKSSFYFDPFNLDIDATPQKVLELLDQGYYGKALSLSFQLNIGDLTLKVWDNIPLESVESIISLASPGLCEDILILLSRNFQNNPRIEAVLLWVYLILKYHGIKIKENRDMPLKGALKILGKYLQDYYIEMRDNSYSLFNLSRFLEFRKLKHDV